MLKKFLKIGSILMLGGMVLSACAPATPTLAPEPTVAPTLDPNDPASQSGLIYAAGSSTVYPLFEAIAEDYTKDGFAGEFKVDSIGSGAGIERFCKSGETDIANASRKIKDSEIESCKSINRTVVGMKVGLDAIAVVVNKQNTFLTNVTTEELSKIFTTAILWSDVRTEWPAEPIQRFVPGTDSGTSEFFAEVVLQKPLGLKTIEEAKELAIKAGNQQSSEDDNVLVTGVEANQFAIGYFGFAYYKNESSKLNTISINGVAPSEKTAESGEYLLSRPLFLYTATEILKSKPQVAYFIKYFLENTNNVITNVGYFPASQETLDAASAAWSEAMK